MVLCAVLCSDRVGQVTKTYHDIKAVTHLLEEVGVLLRTHARTLSEQAFVGLPFTLTSRSAQEYKTLIEGEASRSGEPADVGI